MKPLAGQKVLLIGIGFYDYEVAIAKQFRALGAEIRVEDERPPEFRGFMAGLRRHLSIDMRAALLRHQSAIIERARADGLLDHVVVIKGTLLDREFLIKLRDIQFEAKFTVYHWDSMARTPDLIDRQVMFDRVLTFDHADALTYPSFELRPLFFRPEVTLAGTSPKIDISFIGWLHHQRLKQIGEIRSQAQALKLSGYYYLFTGTWTQTKLRLMGRGQDIKSRALPFELYARTIVASEIILDLPHPDQTGLTMRAIEALGAGKKLITTARDIVKYDFYRPDNICIIKHDAPLLDVDFLAMPQTSVPDDLIARYSLKAWVLDICGITAPDNFLNERMTSQWH